MDSAKRVIVNTLAQHIRAVVNICLSLYSTRLVLDALGKTDYGIYALVAGVVAMLGFITNALLVTTQRYISYYTGSGDVDYVKTIFKNSMFLHVVFGIIMGVVIFLVKDELISSWLVIDVNRQFAAVEVLMCVMVMLVCSIVAAPFKALFIARENIVYISIVEICDSVVKLLIALSLLRFGDDKLMLYAHLMLIIQVLNLLAFAVYALYKYPECSVRISLRDLNKKCQKQLCGFAGWTIYSMGCIVGRNQGMQVVLNHFFGTVLNSAYGIATQVNGSVQFLAQAILNAMNPQIMKAEGRNERSEMLRLAGIASKYAFLLLSIPAIPLIIEMPSVLSFWLKEVPEHSVVFCRFILIAALCDQLTVGLGSANQAIGKIRNYSLVINTLKIMTLPVVWYMLKGKCSIELIMWTYVLIEFGCAMIRLPFLKYTAGMSIIQYSSEVFKPIILPLMSAVFIGLIMTIYIQCPLRFLGTILLSVVVETIVIYFIVLTRVEREKVQSYISKKKKAK